MNELASIESSPSFGQASCQKTDQHYTVAVINKRHLAPYLFLKLFFIFFWCQSGHAKAWQMKLSNGEVRTPYWAFSESVSWFQLSVSACGTSSVECIVSASSRRSRTNAQNPAMLPRTLADQEFCNDSVVFACSEVDRYIIYSY